jgi:hypothetical protein
MAARCGCRVDSPAVIGGLLGAMLLTGAERYELAWQAPGECPAVEQVRERIDELIAYAPEGGGEAILAEVEVRTDAEVGYVASLQLRSGEDEGRRELADVDCRELADAVALIIALAIDPELLSREPEVPEEVPEEQPEEQPEEIDEDEQPAPDLNEDIPATPAIRSRTLGFGLALRGGVGFAVVGPASGRLGLAASSFARWWRVELGGSLWIPQRVDIGRFSIASADLRGCFVPELRSVEFPVCGGVDLGAMIGVGSVAGGRRAIGPWLAATPGVGVSWVGLDDRLALGVRIDAVLPLVRPGFASDEGRLIVRAGFGAQALAGIEVRFFRIRDRRP